MRKVLIHYLRGPKFAFIEGDGTPRASKGHPYGCLVAVKHENGQVTFGHSLTHWADEFKSKTFAFDVAYSRANLFNREHIVPASISKKFAQFEKRAKKFFKV